MENEQILKFLSRSQYSFHQRDKTISFQRPWESKIGELIGSTVILGLLIWVSSSYDGPDSELYLIFAVEVLTYLIYLLYVYRRSVHNVTIDTDARTVMLTPRTEFSHVRTFNFHDIKDVGIRKSVVGDQESPFISYKVYHKKIYIQIGRKKIDLFVIVSKSEELESEISLFQSFLKKCFES